MYYTSEKMEECSFRQGAKWKRKEEVQQDSIMH